jgi:hypothetical protein
MAAAQLQQRLASTYDEHLLRGSSSFGHRASPPPLQELRWPRSRLPAPLSSLCCAPAAPPLHPRRAHMAEVLPSNPLAGVGGSQGKMQRREGRETGGTAMEWMKQDPLGVGSRAIDSRQSQRPSFVSLHFSPIHVSWNVMWNCCSTLLSTPLRLP